MHTVLVVSRRYIDVCECLCMWCVLSSGSHCTCSGSAPRCVCSCISKMIVTLQNKHMK